MEKLCALCGADHTLTFHHLIPRSCHRNKWFRKNFDRADMTSRGIDICRRCHSFLHKQFSEKYLGRELNTVEKILSDRTIQSYVKWARKRNQAS